jgi:SAM-dependent methyltransferase
VEHKNYKAPNGALYSFEYNPASGFVMDPERLHLGGNSKGGDPLGHTPELWAWLVDRYRPRTVLDVGCGEGRAMRWFAEHGVWSLGLEGLPGNADACGGPVVVHDLCDGPLPMMGIDLVWSCEVAEHIEERFCSNFLDTVCRGRVLAMTACPPGGGGWHHVNEQPPEYWVERMRARGMVFDLRDTEISRSVVARDTYWWRHGMIFVRP